MTQPGSISHLPFEWPDSARRLNAHPQQPPPISKYLMRHPWHIPNLFKRNIPANAEARPV